MEKIYKTNLSKEDFKTALTECGKSAWIWHSLDNFKIAVNLRRDQIFEYMSKDKIETEADFESDGKAINLFEIYELSQKKNLNDDEQKMVNSFNQAWTDDDGFDLAQFAGEQIEDGNAIGEAAHDLYAQINAKENKNTKLIEDFSIDKFQTAEAKTRALLENHYDDYAYLFEPAFSYDQENFKVRCDVLKLKPNKHVEIIEFKAVGELKAPHFFDLVYQAWVLEKLGFIVDNLFLGHIDRTYIRGVENPEGLIFKKMIKEWESKILPIAFDEAKAIVDELQPFKIPPEDNEILDKSEYANFLIIDEEYKKNVTFMSLYNDFKKDGNLDHLMVQLTNLMAYDQHQISAYFKQPICEMLMKHFPKQGFNFASFSTTNIACNHVMPWFDKTRETIFNFTGSSNFTAHHKAYAYLETGQIYLDEIKSLNHLDLQLRTDPNKPFFQPQHFIHFDVYKEYAKDPKNFDWNNIITNHFQVGEELKSYEQYPVIMYDFETAKWAIPRFNKINSYYQTPFQYSMDVILNDQFDYQKPSTMEHREFLANVQIDPRPEFIYRFLKDIFSYNQGVYVAYNKAFEQMVLKRLAFLFPQVAKPLMYIVQNTIDLMNFFKGKKGERDWYIVYHPLFNGSYSIKKTQPALAADFTYEDLTINKGDKASQTFREYMDGFIDTKQWKENIYPDLLAYCGRDTLAMVVILQKVKEIFEEGQKHEKI
ncbi:hypothetical protein ELUMI_v1c06610 [Williamsoniiplasma luminosum]|uniref:DUF2779 domain-containing protein n=1 Tax=Williamsoniiplasma luminosum TaxID=214888 RepID=A0A2K8NXL5_9MOLU|nr:DUF2779 domain-containing protein [Williamsoniiplasma luminosum]ATZ17383.1 hypothetical protein ELUMI_v1c06610 [Williamsoniiplasma luminosum]